MNVDLHLIKIYGISGLLAGVAGFLNLAFFQSTTVGGQSNTNLNVIAGVVIGGTSLFGGYGSIFGSIVGLFIPATLQDGFVIVGIQPFWQQVVVGAVLIAAVYVDQSRRAAALRGSTRPRISRLWSRGDPAKLGRSDGGADRPMTTLNSANVGLLAAAVGRPAYDRSAVTAGIVHLSVGGFHRAHEAMYVDALMNQGLAMDWGICGVGLLASNEGMRDVLAAQDGLYTLVVKHNDGTWEPGSSARSWSTCWRPTIRRRSSPGWPTRGSGSSR